ncbi:MAG: hypothetical protein ACI9G1_004230 [Pirellulaceae bacterium]
MPAAVSLLTAVSVSDIYLYSLRHHTPKNILRGDNMSDKNTYRVVTRGVDGSLRIRDYPNEEHLHKTHTQIGVDDCSTDLSLRGLPVFKGLIGPIPEGKNIIRYESPEVFETLTKEWTNAAPTRRRRRRRAPEEVQEKTQEVQETKS